MRVNVVAIGNSKGIRIPKVILQQCHIKEYVDLEVENEYIVIKPYHEKQRRNWEKAFEKNPDNYDVCMNLCGYFNHTGNFDKANYYCTIAQQINRHK